MFIPHVVFVFVPHPNHHDVSLGWITIGFSVGFRWHWPSEIDDRFGPIQVSDVLLRTLGLVEDGDIQSKVLALHKEPHAIVNVNCYDILWFSMWFHVTLLDFMVYCVLPVSLKFPKRSRIIWSTFQRLRGDGSIWARLKSSRTWKTWEDLERV